MNQQERYELLTKLSEFYVKEVKQNLKCFNKVKFITNFAYAIFFIFMCSFVGILCCLVWLGINSLSLDDSKNLCPELIIVAFVGLISFLFCYCMPKLDEMDKKNDFQVLRTSKKGSVILPVSADYEIKKQIMQKFVSLFGDFQWKKSFNHSNDVKKVISLESLNILETPIKNLDDYISGKFKGVKLEMIDVDTSIFQKAFVFLFLTIMIFNITTLITLWVFGCILIVLTIGVFLYWQCTSKNFKGLVVEIDMNKDFEGHTFILEKNNVKDNLTVDKGKYQEVNLEDVEFSNEYIVYSQNQIEARYILTTAFMERIKNIKEIFKAKYVRVSFKDKKIVILIHTGRDMFNLANFLSDIGEKTFVQCFEEICSVLDLVEELKLNEKLGL